MGHQHPTLTEILLHPTPDPPPPARPGRRLHPWIGIGALFLLGIVLALLDPCV